MEEIDTSKNLEPLGARWAGDEDNARRAMAGRRRSARAHGADDSVRA